MATLSIVLTVLLGSNADPVTPGNQTRKVQVGGIERSYYLHVPPSFDISKPIPVVLALHPLATNGPMMAIISGLSEKADKEGFLVAYPSGTGRGTFLHWNVGVFPRDNADDVGYLVKVLDDLAASARVDSKRVFATGFSNGGMMCYRLASEIPDRIAAIAPVAATLTGPLVAPRRPVSVIHFHGTADSIVPYLGSKGPENPGFRMRSVSDTITTWSQFNGCPPQATRAVFPPRNADGLAVNRLSHGPGREGSEVILYEIAGGGHTWPGRPPIAGFLGKSAQDLNANNLIWEFFQKHPIP